MLPSPLPWLLWLRLLLLLLSLPSLSKSFFGFVLFLRRQFRRRLGVRNFNLRGERPSPRRFW